MSPQPGVLVTGGAGYIGSHMCKALAAQGIVPVTLDNLSTGHRDAVIWGPLVVGDLRDRAELAAVLLTHRIGTVLHFAASAYVGQSVADPGAYYDNNVGGMIALLGAVRDAGVARLILSSSCATYGAPPVLPVDETAPQHPVNPYGHSKLMCEQMLRDHAAAYGQRHAILRYFNVAGADPAGALRERHDPETHLVPLAILAAAGRGPALRLFGTDYHTPDGTCVRDYIHVCDVVQAHLLALRHLEAGGADLSLNLGSGQGLSVLQVVAAVEAATGRRVPLAAAARRAGDPPVLVANPARARAALGFRTERSDIATIVRDALPGFCAEMVA